MLLKKMNLFLLLIVIMIISEAASAKTETVRSSDGVKIAYQVRGAGEPALVFVHGWSMDKSVWENQVNTFWPKYRVVVIDVAGHGESGSNRKNYTMSSFGEDIAAVVNHLNLNKVVLIGHSMGGSMIIEAARILGDKVIGLVGADTYQTFEAGETEERAEKFLATFKDNFVGSAQSVGQMYFLPTSNEPLKDKIINKLSSANPKRAMNVLKNSYMYNSIKAAQGIKVPVISINCEKFPVEIDKNMQLVKNFEVKIIHNVGHFVMMEDPAKFNELLQESIDELVRKK